MMVRRLSFLTFVGLLTACSGQPSSDADSSPGADASKPPVSGTPTPSSPAVVASRAAWNDQQGACLDASGKAAYNAAAVGNNSQCVDYTNQDLTGKDFSHFDLRGSSFRNAVLLGVNLDGAVMKGLILTGAEVDSTCILNWMTSGVAPADRCAAANGDVAASPTPDPVPTPGPVAQQPLPTPTPATPPPAPPVPVIVEPPPAETAGTPAPPIVDVTAILENITNVQDVPAYLNQVASTADLESQRLHIRLSSLRMQRWAEQSMARIGGAVVKDDRADVREASKGKDENAKGAAQQILDKDQGEHDVVKKKVEDLITKIHVADQQYRDYVGLKNSVNHINRLIERFDKRFGSFSQQFNSGRDFSALVGTLTDQTEALKKQLVELKKQREAITVTLFNFDDKIDTLENEIEELQSNAKGARGQLQSELAHVRNDRKSAQSQRDQLDAQIQTVNQQLKDARKVLHENTLLARINQLVSR